VWAAYLSHITCCPFARIFGAIPPEQIAKQTYRSEGEWRTTELRTYLWKLYEKVNKSEFVDPLMVKEGEFFVETYDSFMHSPMF
jgi:hypothetical protein